MNKRLTPEQTAKLKLTIKLMHRKKTSAQIAAQYGTSSSNVRNHAVRLGVHFRRRLWEKYEDNIILDNYPECTLNWLSSRLGRTIEQIGARISDLKKMGYKGISKYRVHNA